MFVKKLTILIFFCILSTCFTLAAQESVVDVSGEPATEHTEVSGETTPWQNEGPLFFDGGLGLSTFTHDFGHLIANLMFSAITFKPGGYIGGLYRFNDNWGASANIGVYTNFIALDISIRGGISYFSKDWRFDLFGGYYLQTFGFLEFDTGPEVGFRVSKDGFGIQLSGIYSSIPTFTALYNLLTLFTAPENKKEIFILRFEILYGGIF